MKSPAHSLPIAVAVAVSGWLAACASAPSSRTPDKSRPAAAPDTLRIPPLPIPYIHPPPPADTGAAERGLEFRLVELPASQPAAARSTDPGVPLAPERAAALLARLPPLPDTTPQSFRFPPASPPPPRTGVVVTAGFPPDTSVSPPERPEPVLQPLEVVRIVPEGETQLAPDLTITFNQPMVPLTTVAGTEVRQPPARLTPQPPGRWTWVDTRTLRFRPADRFAMATLYQVEIPAGTRSAAGRTIAEAVTARFATPAPRALGAYPALDPDTARQRRLEQRYGGVEPVRASATTLQPLVVIVFDQSVDADRVLAATRLTANGRPHPLRLATADELAADTIAEVLANDAGAGRWVALRPAAPLPRDADVRAIIGAGALSAEGPRPTDAAQELRFRTYAPLDVVWHGCSQNAPCRPGAPWTVRFNNPLDTASVATARTTIRPALPGTAVQVAGTDLVIRGQALPNTAYDVTISAGVRDRFGQSLTGPRQLTFTIGPVEPRLELVGAPLVVLDPAGPPRVRVHSQGHRSVTVHIHRVTPEEWPQYMRAIQRWRETNTPELPGERVRTDVLQLEPDGFSESVIDVSAALEQGLGHAIVFVEPEDAAAERADRRPSAPSFAWVQRTRIGLSAAADGAELFAWATSLDTGAPLRDVELRLLPSERRAVTGPEGMATLELGSTADAVLVARRGGDSALLPQNVHGYEQGWQRRARVSSLRWLLFSDRGLYQPGETAHVKGWLRELPPGFGPDLMLPRRVSSLAFRLRGPRGEEIGAGELRPGDLGGFHTALALPEGLNLGHAFLEVEPRGPAELTHERGHLPLRVQEFRRPDYQVTLDADPGPHVIGDAVDLSLNAQYFGGGGLSGAEVRWQVRSEPASYAPPGWDRWRFGRAAWWLSPPRTPRTQTLTGETDATGAHRVRAQLLSVQPPFAASLIAEAQVQDVTRQVGSARTTLLVHPAALHVGLRLERAWVAPGQPVTVGVVVVDHDGATVAGRRLDIVRERVTWSWTPRGMDQQLSDSAVACSVTSAREPASCTVTLAEPGLYRLHADVRDDAGRTSRTEVTLWVPGAPGARGADASAVQITPERDEYQPGDTARIIVEAPFFPAEGLLTVRGRGVEATEHFRVTGPTHELRVPITEQHITGISFRVELIDALRGIRAVSGHAALAVPPHQRSLDVSVAPAESVVSPGAETVIDVRVAGADGRPAAGAEVALWMVDEAVLAIGGHTVPDPLATFYAPRYSDLRDYELREHVLPWPVSHGPGTVAAIIVGIGRGAIPGGARVQLEGTDISAATAYDGSFILRGVAPGEYVLRVEAADGTGRRVRITVPPEGVHLGTIGLTPGGADAADIDMKRGAAVDVEEAPAIAVEPPPPPPPPALESLVVTGARAGAEEVEVRADFSALAFFEPSLRTDASGRAQVRVRLPANLTRYRVMAVAVAGARHFGKGEATVTARKDLMARIAAPRFLNYGDRFELPVLVQNGSEQPLSLEVAVQASGLGFTDVAARRVMLPPGERTELLFPASAARAGTARVQVIAAAGSRSDAARIDVPVYTPATAEAFATYGVIDTGAPVVLPVSRPRAVIPEFGGVEVGITSTALLALTDAMLYLHTYPFTGAEQLSSRILAVAALRPVLEAFAAEQLPAREELVASTQRDLARLAGLQNADGGWGFWYAGEASHPFVTVHAAHALQRAAAEGFEVPPAAVARALEYLRGLERHTAGWPLRERQSVTAYAVYVRHRLGDAAATADARRLVTAPPDRVGGELPVEAAAWLLNVLAADAGAQTEASQLRRFLLNRVAETAGGATFTDRYDDGAHLLLHSRRRTDAVVLDALIGADPGSDLIPKLASSLLAHRVRGRWSGTQENAWVLLALNRYFRTYESEQPNFESRLWLNDRFAGSHAFRGRTTERQELSIPMPELLRADTSELLIARQGTGRMYYRAGLRYAPADLLPGALDRGFVVSRIYEAVDDSSDVQRTGDGTWRVRAGARVRVRVLMVAPAQRTHVALVDPLPAGFEPLNPELRGTGFTDAPPPPAPPGVPPPPPPPGRQAPRSWWFVHQNLRNDRAEAFATVLPAGVYEYTYLARATTPGTFVVPPPRAEMLYEPETFGRGAGDTVAIEVAAPRR